MARKNMMRSVLSVFTAALCFGQGSVQANDEIPTLDAVIAQADSIHTFYMMLPPLISMGLALQYDEMSPLDSEGGDCERLRETTFMLGCTVNGVQERDRLRNKDSYAAGSSMYQLLDYQKRPDTGFWAASDFGSALNSFEYKWAYGGDPQLAAQKFFTDLMDICDYQFANGAPQENVNACMRASAQFLVEMAHFVNPQTRNTWVDQVLADTLQIRPTWNGLKFSFSYYGVSSSFGFESIPDAIPGFKENLFKDWGCKRVREDRQAAGCPIA